MAVNYFLPTINVLGWPVSSPTLNLTISEGVIAFQGGPWVISGPFPLPTGAATAANQVIEINELMHISGQLPAVLGQTTSTNSFSVVVASDQSPIPVTLAVESIEIGTVDQGKPNTIANAWPVKPTDGTNSQVYTASGAAKVDGSAVTQPVSAISLPLPTGASTSALQTTINNSIQTVNTTLGSPFQTGGSIGNTQFGVTQITSPWIISGSVTTSPNVNIHDSSGNALNSTTGSLNVDVTNFPSVQPISGTVTANQGTSPWVNNITQFGSNTVVTGTGTSGLGIPRITVSSDSSVLSVQSGTWTTGRTWNLLNTTDSVNVGNFPSTVAVTQSTSPWVVSGTVTTSPNVNIHDAAGNNLTSQANGAQRALDVGIDVAGVQIDPRQIRTLTSSDVVTADQGGTWNINNISGTISLPTGASTSANQTTANTSLSSIVTNTANIPTVGQKTSSASSPVVIASDQIASATSTVTRVASSATNVSLLVSNTSRKAAYLFNESTSIAYVKLGTTASLTSYTIQMVPNSFVVLSQWPIYTGEIDVLWATANGAMQITELT